MDGSESIKLFYISCPDCGLFRVDEFHKFEGSWQCLRCASPVQIEEVPEEDKKRWKSHMDKWKKEPSDESQRP